MTKICSFVPLYYKIVIVVLGVLKVVFLKKKPYFKDFGLHLPVYNVYINYNLYELQV